MPLKNFEIKKGNTGVYVKKLQYILGIKSDGVFGNNTMSTLMLSHGLSFMPSSLYYDLLDKAQPKYITEAKKLVGIREIDIDGDGDPDNRGDKIDEMTKYVFDWFDPSEDVEGYPWCAIFISYVLHKAYGYKFKDARVKVWRKHLQEHGKTVNSKVDFYRDNVYIGLWLNDNGFGHIFFIDPLQSFELEDDGLVATIEGNTNDGGSRDGDGVYKRTRDIKKIEMYRMNKNDLSI